MQLVFQAVLVLSLVVLLNATRKSPSVNLRQRTRPKGKTVRLLLDPPVLPHITSVSASNIANMSLSPWKYRHSFEASRLPMWISHAECLTSGCLSLQGLGEDAALMAKPIVHQVLVLHRVQRQRPNKKSGKKTKKRYDFRLGTEEVAVGCTCVRPIVLPQEISVGRT
ncbi:interleukin 17a/f3 [Labrus mixtus]|uniref:interleukin 17a/f3 n=1 Tax=Labrus mixtus TaxID=508554 RepID=UPI0029C0928E|nr:interleukin 17a/f3 [Labrus mixtus]